MLFALLLGTGRTAGDAAWEGLFHGVAAFNNTGISIIPGGAAAFAGEPAILATIATAVIVGGLGFPVWLELQRNPRHPSRWSLHAKLTLAATGVLLVLGTVGDHGARVVEPEDPRRDERYRPDRERRLLGGHARAPPASRRSTTAGSTPTRSSFTEMLMFAGGGSGSVAGGIKVTTLALLFLVVSPRSAARPR